MCCSLRLLPLLLHCRTVNGDCLVSLSLFETFASFLPSVVGIAA